MKHSILSFLTIVIIINSVISQNGWQQVPSAPGNVFRDFSFVSVETGYLMTPNQLIKTTDGGLSWTIVYADTIPLYSVLFRNEATGFIGAKSKILKTTNGGLSWDLKFAFNFNFHDMEFSSDSNAIAIGFRYEVYGNVYATVVHSHNNGESWFPVWQYSAGYFLNSIAYYDNNMAYISGDGISGGTFLLRSSDKGASWNSQTVNAYIKKLIFPANNLAYGVGQTTQFYKSNTSFSYWVNTFNSPQTLNDAFFLNSQTGYVVGRSGTIFKTLNGGANWYPQSSGTSFVLNRIRMLNDNTGYVIGDNQANGILLKTTDGGGTVGLMLVNNEIPTDFNLFQNYPNPFNPSTKIKFNISGTSSSQTLLTVYDLLGREVAVLVNEKLTPGEYEVDFDGSNLPGGVYYYALSVGDFSETRKMVLIK